MNIKEIERRFHELEKKLKTGAISGAEFEAEVKKLQFQDDTGRYWMIGAQSGKWYFYDGSQWVPGEPPRATKPHPGSLCPSCGQHIEPGAVFCGNCGYRMEAAPLTIPATPMAPMPPRGVTPQAKGGIPGWALIGCGALVVIGVLAGILVVLLTSRGNLAFLRRPTSEPPILPTPAFPLAWQDDFSTPEGGWGEASDLQSVKKYENGRYHISVNASELFIWSTAGQDLADFMAEIEATQISGPNDNGYGLLFRFQDEQHFYRFDISGDGFYLLSKRSGNQWVTLVDWTESPFIHKGQATNRLKVICQGSQISLYVNDHHLTDFSDVSYSHGDIGLFAGTLSQGGTHISFDNLKVWAPEGAAAVVTPSPSVLEVTPTAEALPAVDPSQLITQGDELVLESKFEEAIGAYEQAAQADPTNALAYARWARALYLDRQFDKAVAKAQVATELDPTSAEAFAQLAHSYDWNDQFNQALEAARKAVELDSNYADARASLAVVYLDLDRLDEAGSEAQMAVQLDEQSAEAHRSLGLVYFLKEQLPQTLSEFEKAAQLEPNLWLRQHELASIRRQSEAYVEAIIAYQRAIELRPHAQSYAGLGACYYELGQYEQALPNLQQALNLDPNYADAYALMGWVYARLDQCNQAVPMFQQALSLSPDLEEAQEGLSECQVAMATSTPGPTPAPVVIVATATPLLVTPTPAATLTPTPTAALTGKIAFTLWNGAKYDVWVTNVDGSGRAIIIGEMRQPAFSPDGSRIAVNGEAHYHMHLHVADANGSNLIEVSEHLEDSRPSWAPDGYHIVFDSTMHGDRRSRIYILDDVTKRTEGHILRNAGGDTFGRDPFWLPDGRIVYRGCDYWATGANCGLYIVPPDGSAIPTRLTTDSSDMAPAAHGNKVAFMSMRDGNWEIYSINTDGSDLKRLTNNGVNDGLPAFSPNGQFIALVSDEGGKWAIWAMSADGSGRRKLFDLNGGYGSGEEYDWTTERISWAP
jgi:tetratricopeptide (TPR) repeat protein/Tol biopolymer transport system component